MMIGISNAEPRWLEKINPSTQDFVNLLNWLTNIGLIVILAITGTMIWLRLKKLQH